MSSISAPVRFSRGLVLEETSGTVQFQCIRQDPGEPTKLGPVTRFTADEIRRIDRLNRSERAELETRLEDSSRPPTRSAWPPLSSSLYPGVAKSTGRCATAPITLC